MIQNMLFIDAVGFVTYSNSVPTVLSYAAIFDVSGGI